MPEEVDVVFEAALQKALNFLSERGFKASFHMIANDRRRSRIADDRKETCFHIIADDRKRSQSRL